jgi:Sec-independent protein secretion pathway component TatC
MEIYNKYQPLLAILTPSTDPLTQLLLSSAILLLYFFRIRYLVFTEN